MATPCCLKHSHHQRPTRGLCRVQTLGIALSQPNARPALTHFGHIASPVSKDQMGKRGQMTTIVHIYSNSYHPDESLPEIIQWRHGSRCRVGLLASDNMVEQRGQPVAGMLRGGSANKACYKDKIQDDTINSLLKSVAVKMSSHWTVYSRQGWWAWACCLKLKKTGAKMFQHPALF